MIKLIPLKSLCLFFGGIGIACYLLIPYLNEVILKHYPAPPKWLVLEQTVSVATMLSFGIIFILSCKPVWGLIWKTCWLGPWLSQNIYPDLNGKWEVEIISNWPKIDEMQAALNQKMALHVELEKRAKKITEEDKYPPFTLEKPKEAFPSHKLEIPPAYFIATIDQGWIKSKITLVPTKQTADTANAVLQRSVTLSLDFLQPCDIEPHRLCYIYAQQSQPLKIKDTDVGAFYGGAKLDLLDVEHGVKEMVGLYFTERNWQKGLNAAGIIKYKRI
jgi:hypothetical protein